MQIQINTDKNISGEETLAQSIEDALRFDLSRFSDQITRIEVHLSDENSSAKSGMTDKRCLLEARLAGEHPIAISEQAQTVEEAVTGATKKMVNLLETEMGKRGKWQQ
jgi:ribosome-associated translation inhibitor RaiA